jgi:predicted O-methyltransferase YrrM
VSDLDRAVQVAGSLEEIPDTRPGWLLALPHASDPAARYFRALYEIARVLEPKSILEIGTDRGWSAASMAAGSEGAHVVTIDINPESAEFVARLPIGGITALTLNSGVAFEHVRRFAPFDWAFVDGNHTFNQTFGEYALYRPLVRTGGLMLFDDLALDMAGDEMGVFWEMVVDRKERVDRLHHTGFGVCEVDHAVSLPPWEQVIASASEMMRARR